MPEGNDGHPLSQEDIRTDRPAVGKPNDTRDEAYERAAFEAATKDEFYARRLSREQLEGLPEVTQNGYRFGQSENIECDLYDKGRETSYRFSIYDKDGFSVAQVVFGVYTDSDSGEYRKGSALLTRKTVDEHYTITPLPDITDVTKMKDAVVQTVEQYLPNQE